MSNFPKYRVVGPKYYITGMDVCDGSLEIPQGLGGLGFLTKRYHPKP